MPEDAKAGNAGNADRHSRLQPLSARWLYGAGLICALIFIGAIAIYAPHLHDFAEWVFQGLVLARKLSAPESVEHFALATYPVPNSLALFTLAALNLVFSPALAGKIFTSGLLVLWALAARIFCRRWFSSAEQQAGIWVLIFTLGGFSSFFFYGYIAYQLGCALLLIFLARYDAQSSTFSVAAFAVALFFAHAMPFLCFGLLVFTAVTLCRFPSRQLFALVPAGLLSCAFLIGRYLADFDAPVVGAEWSSFLEAVIYKAGTITMLGPFRNVLLPDGSSLLENYPAVYWLGVASNVTVVFALGCALLWAFWTQRGALLTALSARPVPLKTALLMYALLLCVFCIAAPHHFFGMENPGVRLLIPLLFAALPAFSDLPRVFISGVATVAVSVTLVTTLLYATNLWQSENVERVENSRPPPEVRDSVLAYNEWLYRNTRYRYYNYAVHRLAGRMEQAGDGRLEGLIFRTGPITGWRRGD